ncbi:Uncharacterised protein [Bordetella pertussis]|nr:Uncharacterised protein [Bordetella pertussis]
MSPSRRASTLTAWWMPLVTTIWSASHLTERDRRRCSASARRRGI